MFEKCDNHGKFERFQYFNFETNFLKNVNPSQKTEVLLFS